jgi:hypothetical protein
MTDARAILDANVLFDSYLRDLLLELAVAGIFEPLWTAEILDPDGFLMALTARQPNRVRHATLRILRQYSRQPVSTADLCEAMQRSRCPDFTQWLAGSAQSIG